MPPKKSSKQPAPSTQQAQQQQVDAAAATAVSTSLDDTPVLLKQPLSSVQIAGRVLGFALGAGDVIKMHSLATVSGVFYDTLTNHMPLLQQRVLSLEDDDENVVAARIAKQDQLMRNLVVDAEGAVPDLAWIRIVSASLLSAEKPGTFSFDKTSTLVALCLRTTKDVMLTLLDGNDQVTDEGDSAKKQKMRENRDALLASLLVDLLAYLINGKPGNASSPSGRDNFSVAEQVHIVLSLVERRVASGDLDGASLIGGPPRYTARRALEKFNIATETDSDRNFSNIVEPTLLRVIKLGLVKDSKRLAAWFRGAAMARAETCALALLREVARFDYETEATTLSSELVSACRRGDAWTVELLLRNSSVEINRCVQISRSNEYAVVTACEGEHFDVIELLLNYGCDVTGVCFTQTAKQNFESYFRVRR